MNPSGDYNLVENSPTSSIPESSLLLQLQRKIRSGLQPTQTKLVLESGEVNFYRCQGQEKIQKDCTDEGGKVSYGFVVDTKPDLSWGRVRPWLFISSQDVPQDEEIMKKLGITHVLSLLPGFELCDTVGNLIKQHYVLEVYDEETFFSTPNTTSVAMLAEALSFINNARLDSDLNKILVHCNAGLSRAPTVVMYYLMKQENYTFEEAWKIVAETRPGAKPNRGFINYLRSIECSP